MRIFRMLGRDIRDAFHSVVRNFSLSLASITCIIITLFIVSISIMLSAVVNNFADNVKKDMTIIAFLDVDVTESRITEMKTEIERIDNIESITFDSKKDIANQVMEDSPVFEGILKDYTNEDNPLQDTYLIKVKDVEKIGDTAKTVDYDLSGLTLHCNQCIFLSWEVGRQGLVTHLHTIFPQNREL